MQRLAPVTCLRCKVNQTIRYKYCDECKPKADREREIEWIKKNTDKRLEIERKKNERRKLNGYYKRIYRRRRERTALSRPPPSPRRGEQLLLFCNGCQKDLPRGWFCRNGKYSDGISIYASQCRDCCRPKHALNAAKRRGAGVKKIPHTIWTDMFIKQKGLCEECAQPLSPIKRESHIDHRVPIARGGRHEPENLQLLHAVCNLRKASKLG